MSLIVPLVMYATFGLYNCSQIDYRLLPSTYDVCPIKTRDDSGVYHLMGVVYDTCCYDETRCRCCKYVNDYNYFLGCPYYTSFWNLYISDYWK